MTIKENSFQGQTIQEGAKTVIHWSKRFKDFNNAGMAFVCLGRSKRLQDIYIQGDVDPAGIHASPEALAENERLDKIFDESIQKENDIKDKHWIVSYLNVRSLKGHKNDVEIDSTLMQSDVIGLGETWLKPDENVKLNGFTGSFASYGRGKGVASFCKLDSVPCTVNHSFASENISAIHLTTNRFDIIFLYLSNGFSKEDLFHLLDSWIENKTPTAIMGDVNWKYSEDNKMKRYMENKGFKQLIDKATCDSGSLLDHLYVNQSLSTMNVFSRQTPTYYSDHDVLSLYIPKEK